MSNITEVTGNIFTSESQTLVNTVNCNGVMGAGIALEFKLRHPEMFRQYVEHCKKGRIDIGKLWIYKPPPDAGDRRWVLNFPTKRNWKMPSRWEYLESGLAKFVATYYQKGITSAAFPALGATNGGLDEETVIDLMRRYLTECDIPVAIYRYDPQAVDDLYDRFRAVLLDLDDQAAATATGLRVNYVKKIKDAMVQRHDVNSMSQLAAVKGIGLVSLEKSFRYVMDRADQVNSQPRQPSLESAFIQ